ncbi:uncharacterized protein LOC124934683 [Impatiens glandulifera]|uniref:uncharacterized protein LOC124934683 n=1 Tax=Impatiens glandulifera TaxID=253017 RepID=UPI001FB11CB6|nr:uncharacterized protein LOC124934683 [Impatiens glandulifera]
MIRLMATKRISRKRRSIHKWHQNISPKAKKLLELSKSRYHECHLDFNGSTGYEITQGDHRHAVDLINEKCSCRLWNIRGIPCTHVFCAIYHSSGNIEDYISHWYKKDTYLKAYMVDIQTLRGPEFWKSDIKEKILSPKQGRPLGRPKTSRRRTPEEPKSHGKRSRKGRKMHCTNCGKEGHNKKGCNTIASGGIANAPPSDDLGTYTQAQSLQRHVPQGQPSQEPFSQGQSSQRPFSQGQSSQKSFSQGQSSQQPFSQRQSSQGEFSSLLHNILGNIKKLITYDIILGTRAVTHSGSGGDGRIGGDRDIEIGGSRGASEPIIIGATQLQHDIRPPGLMWRSTPAISTRQLQDAVNEQKRKLFGKDKLTK